MGFARVPRVHPHESPFEPERNEHFLPFLDSTFRPSGIISYLLRVPAAIASTRVVILKGISGCPRQDASGGARTSAAYPRVAALSCITFVKYYPGRNRLTVNI